MKKYYCTHLLILDIKNDIFTIYILNKHISYFGKFFLNLNLIKKCLETYKNVVIKNEDNKILTNFNQILIIQVPT